MSPYGSQQLLGQVAMPSETRHSVEYHLERFNLTEQQRQIVALLLGGASTKEVCAELDISVKTFQTSFSAIATKVGKPGTDRLVVVLTILGIGEST